MNKPLKSLGGAGCLVLLMACQSWGQVGTTTPPTTTTPPAQPPAGGNRGNTQQQDQTQQQNRDTRELPLYVEGQILNENGVSPTEPIPLKLTCGIRTVQSIRTDIRGYFRFALGAGTQANTDFSAADEAPASSILTGINVPGGYSGFGGSSSSLTGCEIRISLPGYLPLVLPITDPASLGIIDVGVLELRRVGTAPTGSVSATSLLVPNSARKEFDQGVKDLNSNRLPQATQHLERAVGAYDKYAAAWTELGRAYAANRQNDKARQSYEKAIEADSRYAPPYISLAGVKLEGQDYEGALESVGKAVEIDPNITRGIAGYIQGVANYKLNRLDAAQESFLQAERAPHPTIPILHVMLTDIYLRKQDSTNAATHIRAYLREAPQGPFAAELKKHLDTIDQQTKAAGGDSGAKPLIAP